MIHHVLKYGVTIIKVLIFLWLSCKFNEIPMKNTIGYGCFVHNVQKGNLFWKDKKGRTRKKPEKEELCKWSHVNLLYT